MKKKIIIFLSIMAIVGIMLLLLYEYQWYQTKSEMAYKPVIYLYPETEQVTSVRLDVNGELTCTYPAYKDGWKVTACPDGTLIDKNGQTYNYLYYEAALSTEFDFTSGYCVKGEDTTEFLEKILPQLGLNRQEANEFIVYWLPLMQNNEYNLISFQSERYEDAVGLNIYPAPETVIRVFMTYKAVDRAIEIDPQNIKTPERNGFTVVEWGGTCLD